MSQYQAIKAATNAYIKTNGRQEITGAILNAVMIATIDSLGRFYQFVGGATPDTDPGTIDQNIAYLASTPGTYTHLGGITIDAGELAVIKFDGEWHKEAVATIPAKVSQLENDLGFITNAVSDLVNYYTKVETFSKAEVTSILSGYYDKGEVDSIVSALTGQSYVVAWDGTAEPVVGDIPAGVSVTWGGNPYVGTLPASASTAGKIYLVSNGAGYDEYITTEDGGYSWVGIGTTSIDLSGYATKAELTQLEHEVHNLSGKYYGVFPAAGDLPEGDGVGYAYVGANEPFAIYNFDGTSWSDSGSEAIGLQGPQGPQGNSGYTGAAGELEVVNNLEDGGATAALSAEMGKLLSRNMKLLYDSMGAAAFWGEKPIIDWSGNTVPVSLTLTDCSIDNMADSVPLGDSYEATITPDSGGVLVSVVCTMNGEPQTVLNGHIYIAEVTGAIIISALGMNLDSVAYESLTYRQIFETNNYLGISPGFENGSYSPLEVALGDPAITTEDKDSGTYSLKLVGTGSSSQLKTSTKTNKAIFIACRVKVENWSVGEAGMQVGIVDYAATEDSDTDWTTVSLHKAATTTDYSVFVGLFRYPELTAYIDTPVAVLDQVFGTAPSLADFTALYNNYVAIKKAE